jgi:ABC-type branched-subunit amino acid transport system ATPase component
MLLEVSELEAGYGEKRVISGVSLVVGEREVVALLGHNGAGKTTLLNAIFGVIRPSKGTIRFGDKNITGQKPSDNVRDGIGYSPQGAEVFRTLTVMDNLLLGGFAVADQTKVAQSITRIQELFPPLYERRNFRAGALSGGERQMLSLGALLVSSPRLVILDEPSGGLSPLMVGKMYDAIRDVAEKLDASVLLVEQDANHALEIAQRAYVLANGRVTFDGTARELAGSPDLGRLLVGF